MLSSAIIWKLAFFFLQSLFFVPSDFHISKHKMLRVAVVRHSTSSMVGLRTAVFITQQRRCLSFRAPCSGTCNTKRDPVSSSICDVEVLQIRCRTSDRGFLRPTPVLLLWWGYKESDLHRLSRERPWWENIALIIGTVLVVLISALGYSFGNKIYYTIRPAGNDVYVVQELDAKVFSRPDLSVALVRMALHHLMTQAPTPFGAPMVAPPELKAEAEELLEFVKRIHAEQPQFSIPDLWALMCSKALERLGGPIVHPLRGRPHLDAKGPKETLLTFPPNVVLTTQRDVLRFKRLLASQRYSVDEAVAALAGLRNIGYHPAVLGQVAAASGTESMRPATLVERVDKAHPTPETQLTAKVTTQRKCSLDPYVFGGEYFNYLLDYHWDEQPVQSLKHPMDRRDGEGHTVSSPSLWRTLIGQGSSASQAHSKVWTCSEGRRRRVDVLVDPLSEAYAVREKMKRTLEPEEMEQWEAEQERARRENPFTAAQGALVSPCDSISMEAIDVMLLDDAMTLGWVKKFSENEVKFYTSFGLVVDKILSKGYNVNELFNLKR